MTGSTENRNLTPQLGMLGFGEAGIAFATGWQRDGVNLSLKAFDVKTTASSPVAHRKRDDYGRLGVVGCDSATAVVEDVVAVFSLVTADQAVSAARSAAAEIREGTFYFDCNSCAPQSKKEAAGLIEAGGGRYVDAAVMAPVHPDLHKSQIFISGAAADDALGLLGTLGMNVQRVPGEVGAASAIKLTRSIMMKGLEALMAECVLAGVTQGVDDLVLQTLEQTYPGFGWKERAAQMLERMMVHGHRRAAEMREAAAMVDGLGLPALTAHATASWQQQIGDLQLDAGSAQYPNRAKAILDAMQAIAENVE